MTEGDAGAPSDRTVEVNWSTGFENDFCDYALAHGFCYAGPDARFESVTTPVHGGQVAAAFSVSSSPDLDGLQSRCVQEGVLPDVAYYGAWFYLPTPTQNTQNWNLMHFQGGEVGGGPDFDLWDVSISTNDDGTHTLYVRDFLRGEALIFPMQPRLVPLRTWFHIVFRLQRAADETGSVALYQDGELLVELTDISTDNTAWGQWYVGNLVAYNALTPPDSTIYVDDVSIMPTL